MTDSFWAGGANAYETGLHRHYAALLGDLRDRLSSCLDAVERAEFESQVQLVESEYQTKLNGIGDLLF